VLILDEATSALDPLTEKSILKTIEELSGTKTIIIVTHKMNMVKHCDTVVWLEDGRVKQSGTYAEIHQSNADFFEQ
jgi:ABC-type bacteriocin/lantibiotic exporter with double-glycine peptidase domain